MSGPGAGVVIPSPVWVRSGQSRPALRTRSPGLCTVPAALKDPNVRACVRAPASPAARGTRGAGSAAVPRLGLTCPRSPLPFPGAAGVNGYSCQINERLVAVVRRTYSGMTITKGLDTNEWISKI